MSEQAEPKVTVTLELSQRVADLLTVLTTGEYGPADLEGVLYKLVDHAQQGVYRPGAWERGWLEQAFGDGWQAGLETDWDDPTGDGRYPFERPIKPCPNDPQCEHTQGVHLHDAIGWYCDDDGCKCGALPEDDEDDDDE